MSAVGDIGAGAATAAGGMGGGSGGGGGGMSANPNYDPNLVNKPVTFGGTTYSVGD